MANGNGDRSTSIRGLMHLWLRRGLVIICAYVLATPFAGAQDTRPTRAVHDSLHRTIEAILTRGIADSAFPGAIAVIGSKSGPIATVSAGHVDWAPSQAVTPTTVWDLASLTKVVGMTSAVMQLVERGRIDLDAPVQRYLPEWTGPNKDRVTVRHLITHQSGLPSFRKYFEANVSPDSIRHLFITTPLDSAPGTRMIYSDIGAILLGMIIERQGGMALDEYLTRNVFRPMGMLETRYKPPLEWRSRIAPTEKDPWRGRHLVGEVHDENAFALGQVSGHAGLFSTAHDLERFARAYLNGGALGDGRLARASTIAQFTRVADSSFSSRALGWDTPAGPNSSAGRFIKRPAFGHTGYTGTSMWIAPQHDLYIILLTNRVNPTRANTRIGAIRGAVADAAMRLLEPGVVARLDAQGSTAPGRR